MAARQFLSLNCLAITLTARVILKEEKCPLVKFGGVRAEVSGRGPKLLRSCLGVEIPIQKSSEAKF